MLQYPYYRGILMMNVRIAVINASSEISYDEFDQAVRAVQTQVHRDFAPVWQVDADIEAVPRNAILPEQAWWVAVLDNSDLGGALGYHDLTSAGLPMGKVFAATDKYNGLSWTVSLSHEILEMLVDPNINRTAFEQTPSGSLFHAYEVGDACESDRFGYKIDDQLVSDFLYPPWFSPLPLTTRFDHSNKIQRPFELLPGGFSMVYDLTYLTGWHILVADDASQDYNVRPRVGSRRERRRTHRSAWIKSHALPTR
jgi:hypothetical protein